MRNAIATSAVVVSLVSVIACGSGSSSGPDAGLTPDPAYWGLASQECRFFDDGSGMNAYTLAINTDTVTVGGMTTWQLLYRTNGFETRTDWLGVTNDRLQLYRQHIPAASGSTSDTYISYAPAPDYLVENLAVNTQAHVTSTTATVTTGGMNTTEMLQLTLNVAEVDPLMWQGKTVQVPQYLITTSGGPTTTTQTLWFAPNIGIMQIALPNGTNLVLTQISSNVPAAMCVPP
jgi:hypothetical protein